jgi:type IV secretory pathway VirB10-like protein
MDQPIQVQEKAPKPPGLLPKNVQAWLLMGLALFMVVIMWLTGGKKPQPLPKAGTSVLPTQAPLEVNETKIVELQTRIQELQREQLVAQNALTQQSRLLAGASPDPQQPLQQTSINGSQTERPQDVILAERKKREYLSLFASNVAVTYRKMPVSEQGLAAEPGPPFRGTAATSPDPLQIAQFLRDSQALPAMQIPAPTPPVSPPPPSTGTNPDRKEVDRNSAADSPRAAGAATRKTYVLFEGTVLETVLLNRLDGSLAGPVECLLTTDVYSHGRQHLLIPEGSKLLGETKKVDTFGQSRLAVVFHRLLMPDGYSVNLDQFKGLNQMGDAGLRDQVNNHYLRIFGVSLAIGALGAVSEAGTSGSLTASASDLMRQGFAQSTAQSSARILDKFLNVLPTVTIREGHRVKVYLSGDLVLPDYNNHKLPSDL